MQWLGERIYASECNSRFDCLASWNEGEAFPSLGIGHFIWYQAGQSEVFEEAFPALLKWLREQGAELPTWLAEQSDPNSPWRSRAHFLEETDSARTTELREFLANTQALQVAFIARRLQQQLPSILNASANNSQLLAARFYAVANTAAPHGIYALIDYLHFKGSGSNPAERYNNVGWGLLQVLENMQSDDLPGFVAAAEYVLLRRVQNAPADRNEQRWLQGWHNRVNGYLPLH